VRTALFLFFLRLDARMTATIINLSTHLIEFDDNQVDSVTLRQQYCCWRCSACRDGLNADEKSLRIDIAITAYLLARKRLNRKLPGDVTSSEHRALVRRWSKSNLNATGQPRDSDDHH
jgi:hypothetical protein